MNFSGFTAPETLAEALADYVAVALQKQVQAHGQAVFAVSGGNTPMRFFTALSKTALDWERVTITLVDDRWVPDSSPRSNAGLVRRYLLQNHAAAAVFVPLVNQAATPEAGRAAVDAVVARLALPFAVVVLGMGLDGHTAGFFPRGDRLAAALAPRHGQLVESMRADAAIEPRITLTLPVLLAARHVALHIEGEAKRALLATPNPELPVNAVLAQRPGTDIFWSP